jgi:hypothetical protein
MIRTRRSLRLLALAIMAACAAASIAVAAEPSSGTIGKSAPKISWAGEFTNSGIYYNAWAQDPTFACSAPACDAFALTVADAGVNVTVKVNNDSQNTAGGDPGCGLRIKFPDGSYQYTQSPCGPKTTLSVKLKNVKAGEYELANVSSHVCCGTEGYTASAEIPELAAGAPAPAPGTPAPSPTPPASQQQQPSPQLTVKPSRASAKKLTKTHRYTVTASTTARLTNVTARLLKGKKAIGTAKLARLEGTANLVLKLGRKTKVKKGSYTVTVSGADAQGRIVTTAVKVKAGR